MQEDIQEPREGGTDRRPATTEVCHRPFWDNCSAEVCRLLYSNRDMTMVSDVVSQKQQPLWLSFSPELLLLCPWGLCLRRRLKHPLLCLPWGGHAGVFSPYGSVPT